MTLTAHQLAFSLADLHQSASQLLELRPGCIVTYRLLREVLRPPPDDPLLAQAKDAAVNSKWVNQLNESQLPDGSWGRFHSQDTRKKTVFRTTEAAIDRAFALGLEPREGCLARVQHYIMEVLRGEEHITDRKEKSESWPLLIKFILAGRLAQIDPHNKWLALFWVYLEEVTDHAFISGEYRLDDEAAAYLRLSGIHVPQGFLESQHALWVLSSHPLSSDLEHALVSWIWNKADGIRYIRAPLANPQPRQIGYWLRSMNILSRFPSWREICADGLNRLWDQRNEQECWDFDTHIAMCVDFPLSENWRQGINRRLDFSTSILALLRRCFD
jgi:hypothetical protein